MKKKLIIPAIALSLVLGLGYLGFSKSQVYAQEDTFPPMLQRLTERFNLNEEEVSNFMEETREEHRADRKNQITEKLNEAVSNGILTEDQKNELLSIIETDSGERQQHRDEVQAWAEENGVNLADLDLGFHGFGGFGRGMGPKEGDKGRYGFDGECPCVNQ